MGRGGGKGRARLGLSYDVTGWHGGEGRGGGGGWRKRSYERHNREQNPHEGKLAI